MNILIVGIDPKDRAQLRGNLDTSSPRGYELQVGPTGRNFDPLFPLPQYSKWFLDSKVLDHSISKNHLKVICMMIYILS